ncbi:amidase family protein, partial [Candidatus Marinimicrobia bacterium]|nr:amidase family protein [Candidatus Neomarinimicrobiota bacterium]
GLILLNKNKYDTLRMLELTNDVPLPLHFNPLIEGESIPKGNDDYLFEEFPIKKPSKIEDCAFYTIGQLAYLIRTRQITSEELTRMYIERLKEYGPQLECVITVTEELGIKQARKADEEIKNGRYLGPLHGIPYGAKDLLAVSGYKTTWGANTHKDQIINETATVIKKKKKFWCCFDREINSRGTCMGRYLVWWKNSQPMEYRKRIKWKFCWARICNCSRLSCFFDWI